MPSRGDVVDFDQISYPSHMDKKLLEWYTEAEQAVQTGKLEYVNDNTLLFKAIEFSEGMKQDDAEEKKIDQNWIQWWKKWHAITFKWAHGEAAAVMPEMTHE